MKAILKNYTELLMAWFESVVPLVEASYKKETGIWVMLQEFPFYAWHINSFKALAECWGVFIGVYKST